MTNMSREPSAGPGRPGDERLVDYASGEHADSWLRHPVYGDPSFDTFERLPGNPVVRGAAPYEWPVNGYLFADPQSGDWFLYVGHYREGYARDSEHPSMCTVSRSRDNGRTWEHLGPIFQPTEFFFDGEVSPQASAPDVTVVYAEGRYHMAFDWATRSSSWANAAAPTADANSGGAYAWAERPEGPWRREPRPVVTTREQTPLRGKYRRMYATTILPRRNDWLALTLTDSQKYYGWGYTGMTASRPEGPYTRPKLLLHPECDGFHPPLLEFHPAFSFEGYVYAPATSVALNRNYNTVFRAPLEDAMDPRAWQLHRHGSVWHAARVDHEAFGIWGQTFAGFVDSRRQFTVMFPSRDSSGMGTINLARRPWDTPYRRRSFVLSGHEGPSIARLNKRGPFAHIAAAFTLHGAAALLLDLCGPLGPDRPASNATLHPLCKSDCTAVEITANSWAVVEIDAAGAPTVVATGDRGGSERVSVRIDAGDPDGVAVVIDHDAVWRGPLAGGRGATALWVGSQSWIEVDSFLVGGDTCSSAEVPYLYAEGLLGAAQNMDHWEAREDPAFRYGFGAVSRPGAGVQAKWNIEGDGFAVWAPRGPQYGRAAVLVDGRTEGEIDYRANAPTRSAELFRTSGLAGERHGVFLRPIEGRIPIDVLVANPE